MIIGVFGDVHGALDAVYEAVARWEYSNSKEIQYILLAGDLNCFPDLSRIDKTTRKHGKEDPTNYGTQNYILGRRTAAKPTYFVRGNHEDFDFLKLRENRPIDPHGMIINLDGPLLLKGANGEVCSIYGLGGIQPGPDSYADHPEKVGREYISEQEFNKAMEQGSPDKFQILLTHDGPSGFSLKQNPVAGSQWIKELIARTVPRVHFFGHYDKPPEPLIFGGSEYGTLVVPLNQTDSRYYHLPKRDGCFALLDTEKWKVSFAGQDMSCISTPS